MRELLATILGFLAKMTIRKFTPEVIAVTGSAGKTSVKEAAYVVLKKRYRVRKTPKNLNTEIGVPLTILGNYQKSGGIFFWGYVILRACVALLIPKGFQRYPQILMLEYAADKPGDITHLVHIAPPDISIVTVIGDMPVHVEFYKSADAVREEKAEIVRSLSRHGIAVLNTDDRRVLSMQDDTRGKVVTYGKDASAMLRITDVTTKIGTKNGTPYPEGVSFHLHHESGSAQIMLRGVLGEAQVYAVAAAVAVGLLKNIPIRESAKTFAYYQPPQQRLSCVRGIQNSLILDDSYNSSPIAAMNALKALSQIDAPRKIAVLGDMRELGGYTTKAHERVGAFAATVATDLYTIGSSAAVIADTVIREGMSEEKVHRYMSAEEVAEVLKDRVEQKDVILVKASLAMNAAHVVEALRAKNPSGML